MSTEYKEYLGSALLNNSIFGLSELYEEKSEGVMPNMKVK